MDSCPGAFRRQNLGLQPIESLPQTSSVAWNVYLRLSCCTRPWVLAKVVWGLSSLLLTDFGHFLLDDEWHMDFVTFHHFSAEYLGNQLGWQRREVAPEEGLIRVSWKTYSFQSFWTPRRCILVEFGCRHHFVIHQSHFRFSWLEYRVGLSLLERDTGPPRSSNLLHNQLLTLILSTLETGAVPPSQGGDEAAVATESILAAKGDFIDQSHCRSVQCISPLVQHYRSVPLWETT